jgi:hypothetical protein
VAISIEEPNADRWPKRLIHSGGETPVSINRGLKKAIMQSPNLYARGKMSCFRAVGGLGNLPEIVPTRGACKGEASDRIHANRYGVRFRAWIWIGCGG